MSIPNSQFPIPNWPFAATRGRLHLGAGCPGFHTAASNHAFGNWELEGIWLAGMRRSLSECGAMRPARTVSSKNAPEARPFAEAPIRHQRVETPVIQPIGRRPSDHPSRSGQRQDIAGGGFFRASGRGAAVRQVPAQWDPLTRNGGNLGVDAGPTSGTEINRERVNSWLS
jgi:hypothetical protein